MMLILLASGNGCWSVYAPAARGYARQLGLVLAGTSKPSNDQQPELVSRKPSDPAANGMYKHLWGTCRKLMACINTCGVHARS